MEYGSGRCILPPGKKGMKKSSANMAAYSSASLWREVFELVYNM
jgi:hypothetical protein